MKIESSKEANQNNFSKKLKIEKNSLVCKDGFCVIPNPDDNSNIKSQGKRNFFDPI